MNIYIIKFLILFLVLIFNFQSLARADDIRDFQIEGLSIGDSALKYFNVKDLEKAKKERYTYFYPKNEFVKIAISTGEEKGSTLHIFSKTYDDLSITVKPKDENYIIYSLSGRLYCEESIKICINLQSDAIKDLDYILKNARKNTYKDPHPSDPTNKSFIYGNDFYFKDKGSISISVYDWSDKMTKERDWHDSLQVGVNSEIFDKFLWYIYK